MTCIYYETRKRIGWVWFCNWWLRFPAKVTGNGYQCNAPTTLHRGVKCRGRLATIEIHIITARFANNNSSVSRICKLLYVSIPIRRSTVREGCVSIVFYARFGVLTSTLLSLSMDLNGTPINHAIINWQWIMHFYRAFKSNGSNVGKKSVCGGFGNMIWKSIQTCIFIAFCSDLTQVQ